MSAAPLRNTRDRKAPPRTTLVQGLSWLAGFRTRALELTRRSYEEHGPVVSTGFGIMDSVGMFGPEANRLVLLDRDRIFSAKRSWELIMGRIFGGGLLLRDGEDHRHHRGLLREAFKTPALEGYCDTMNPLIARGIDDWLARGETTEAFPVLKHLTLGLAWSVFIGAALGRSESRRLNRAFEDTVAASMSIVRLPIWGLEFQRGLAGRKALSEYFCALLAERRRASGDDILSRLASAEDETGRRLSDLEIAEHMNFLMMAAHDTTTSTLTSMLYLLAKHPEWQERVREECGGLGRATLGFEDRDRLPVTTRCMHETLRLYPPLSTIPRVATRAFEFAGYEIPEGALVSVFPLHTHRMSEWWSDPDAFDPERFAPERAEHQRHSHQFVPFGGGEHMCLGLRFAEMQIRAFVHQLVQKARWQVAPDYEMPVQEAPISKPRDGLPLRITPL